MLKRGAGAVQFVYKTNARHFGVVGIAPVGLGLRLHSGHAVKNHYRPV